MGIHPEFSSFDRRSADFDGARRTMWVWAEPVIIDRAVEAYARVLDESGTVAMAGRHCRLWHRVLLDQTQRVEPYLDEMRRSAVSLGLGDGLVDRVNDLILEELVDIVTSRYRSSRNTMKTMSMVLMSATSCLGAGWSLV